MEGEKMESYKFLLDLSLILLSTKLLGMLTRRIQLPQVVGALLAGIVLGPACFGIIQETDFIKSLAEVGVIVLMFSAGLETDVQELKKSGLAASVIALFGVLVPLAGGFGAAYLFNKGHDMMTIFQNIFIGVVLTATSVSITVETLKELGKLNTRSGNAILGAALVDDVLGIIALTVITSFADSSVSIGLIFLKIAGFFVFCGVVALIFMKFVIPWINKYRKDLRRFTILGFAFCLLMAFAAEYFFGVSDITGAFVAGVILSANKKTNYLISRFNTVSYMVLSPVFFAHVGLMVTLGDMSPQIILFSVILLIVAIATKIVGCGLGAKCCGYTNLQAAKIGLGMISRGEVALIVATKGAALGLMREEFFAPIIIVVVLTTIAAPVFLKMIYKYQESRTIIDTPEHTGFVRGVQRRHQMEVDIQKVSYYHENDEQHEEHKEK